MASVLAVVSKAIFEKTLTGTTEACRVGDLLGQSRYESRHAGLDPLTDGGALFLVTVRPPNERLWLVAILESPKADAKGWKAKTNTIPIVDISDLRTKLVFSTGKGMSQKAGALGMSLQTPRTLTVEDEARLREAVTHNGMAKPAKAAAVEATIEQEKPEPVAALPGISVLPASPDLAPLLAEARNALDGDNRARALEALLGAWRVCRAPELEVAIDLVSKDVNRALSAIEPSDPDAFDTEWHAVEHTKRSIDVERLLATLTHKPRGGIPMRVRALLDRGPDPRVGAVLASMIESPPTTASSNFSMWTQVFAVLADYVDNRVAGRLQKRADTKGGGSRFWPKLTDWINGALNKLPEPASLSKNDAATVQHLTKRARELATASPQVLPVPMATEATSTSGSLESVGRLLAQGKGPQALDELRTVWADCRLPEIAGTLDTLGNLVDQKEPTLAAEKEGLHQAWMAQGANNPAARRVGPLMEVLRNAKVAELEQRLLQLVNWTPDPRVARAVLAVSEDYMLGERAGLWRSLHQALAHHADPRLRAQVVAKRGRGGMSGRFASETEAVFDANCEKRRALSDAERRVLAEIQLTLHDLDVWVGKPVRQAQVEELEQLKAVIADRESDEALMVYADWLIERADPRGELIQKAVRRSKNKRIQSERDIKEKAVKEALLGPLLPVASHWSVCSGLLDDFSYEGRGALRLSPAKLMAVFTDCRWATVRHLGEWGDVPEQLLAKAPLYSLTTLRVISVPKLVVLARREDACTLPLETVELSIGDSEDCSDLGKLPAGVLPKLRHAEVGMWGEKLGSTPLDQFFQAPLIRQLDRITYGDDRTGGILHLTPWLRRVCDTKYPSSVHVVTADGSAVLIPDGQGRITLELTAGSLFPKGAELLSLVEQIGALRIEDIITVKATVGPFIHEYSKQEVLNALANLKKRGVEVTVRTPVAPSP